MIAGARRINSLRNLPYSTEAPFRWLGVAPIRSRTPAVSSIRVRTLGAKLDLLSPGVTLRLSAEHAAKEIMMTVLLGIDLSRVSPCIAARRTFNAAESPAARKKRFTSMGAVGWLMTPPYVES